MNDARSARSQLASQAANRTHLGLNFQSRGTSPAPARPPACLLCSQNEDVCRLRRGLSHTFYFDSFDVERAVTPAAMLCMVCGPAKERRQLCRDGQRAGQLCAACPACPRVCAFATWNGLLCALEQRNPSKLFQQERAGLVYLRPSCAPRKCCIVPHGCRGPACCERMPRLKGRRRCVPGRALPGPLASRTPQPHAAVHIPCPQRLGGWLPCRLLLPASFRPVAAHILRVCCSRDWCLRPAAQPFWPCRARLPARPSLLYSL